MGLKTRVSNAFIVFREQEIQRRFEISEKDIVIFVIGSTGSGKSTIINTALTGKPMVVGEPAALVSCTKKIQMFKCTGPWNPYGRSVVFVDIPAFNHSNSEIQRRVPDLINTWLDANCTGKSVDSGILYLHAMLPRLNEGFDKHLDPFVKLCHNKGHKPISVLLVSTMWPNHGTEESERIKDLEGHFMKTATDIHKIPVSIRSHNNQKSACEAMTALLDDIIAVKKMEDESRARPPQL